MAKAPMRQFKKKRMAEINVVPYIDVMLVLLVIFMVTATKFTEGFQVELPEASAQPVKKSKVQPIIIAVDRKGRYYINLGSGQSKPSKPHKIVEKVKKRRKQHPDVTIYIKGDFQAKYGKVINIMSILNQAGIDDFSLITEPDT